MYDPTIGRWLEQDPDGFAAGDPNLYRYVGNDPVNATDPSGLTERLVTWRNARNAAGAGTAIGVGILVYRHLFNATANALLVQVCRAKF